MPRKTVHGLQDGTCSGPALHLGSVSSPALSSWGRLRLSPSAHTWHPWCWPAYSSLGIGPSALRRMHSFPDRRELVHRPRAYSPACLGSSHSELQGSLILLSVPLTCFVVFNNLHLYLTFSFMFVSIRLFLVKLRTGHFSPECVSPRADVSCFTISLFH